MKKVYFLLLLCLFSLKGSATTWHTCSSGDVTALTSWWTGTSLASCTIECDSFTNPADTFLIGNAMTIGAGETWSVRGTVVLVTNQISISTGTATLDIGSALILNGSTKITDGFSGGNLYINDSGKLYVNNTARITGLAGFIHVNMVNPTRTISTPQVLSWTSTGASSGNVSLTIAANSFVQLVGNVHLPTGSATSDSLNGSLDCGTYTIGSANTDTFVISDGAAIYTAHTGGLDSSIQQMYARKYSSSAGYIFDGVAAQVTGVTMVDSICKGATAGDGYVTINNRAGVTLSAALLFGNSSILNLELGTFTEGSLFSTDNGTASYFPGVQVNVDSGTFATPPQYGHNVVSVVYDSLGNDALAFTTGNELIPASVADTIFSVSVAKRGATITLGSSFMTNSLSISNGTLDASASSYNITIAESPINGAGSFQSWSPGVFLPHNDTVFFEDNITSAHPAGSMIWGDPVTFSNILVNGSHDLFVDTTVTITGSLILNSGNVVIGADTLIMGGAASIAGSTPSGSNMIVADSTGVVEKQIVALQSFTFPIGDKLGNYSPITVNLTGGTLLGNAYVAVNDTNVKHPHNASANNYLKRYWRTYLGNIAAPSYVDYITYVPGDVAGHEDSISFGQYLGALPWIKGGVANTVSHTLTSGTLNALVSAVTGISSAGPSITVPSDTLQLCIGASTTLAITSSYGDPTMTYNWYAPPGASLSTTTGLSVSFTPSFLTGVFTFTVVATDGDGFTDTADINVLVKNAPYFYDITVSGSGSACVGDTVTFTANDTSNIAAYLWSGPVHPNTGDSAYMATINYATLGATGTYTLTVTNDTGAGCTLTMTASLTVNDTPNHLTVTGGGTFCGQDTIVASGSLGIGDIYFEGTTAGGTLMLALPDSAQLITATGTYYFRANNGTCWSPDASVTVSINPLPVQYTVDATGVMAEGHFCKHDTGVHVYINMSDLGISYQLYNGGTAVGSAQPGTGSSIDFGLTNMPGANYYVVATDTTSGCGDTMLSGSSFTGVIMDSLPVQYPFSSTPQGYCPGGTGVDISLNYSDYTDIYTLYHNGTVEAGPTGGVGGLLDFGGGAIYTDTGIYMVVAQDVTYGCIDTMTSVDSVYLFALPNIYAVQGTDTECANGAGANIYLNHNDAGVTYLLYENWAGGTSPAGSIGDSLQFGPMQSWIPGNPPLTAGDYYYTITAQSAEGCLDTMADSGYIHVNPLPVQYNVSGGGMYCATTPVSYGISTDGSDLTANYTLYNDGALVAGSFTAGTGVGISWGPYTDTGTYAVVATDAVTGCIDTMMGNPAIISNPMPDTTISVSGGGIECANGVGFNINTSGSEGFSTTYYLYQNGGAVGASLSGTGSGLSFGPELVGPGVTPGDYTYTVLAQTSYGCSGWLRDSGFIHVNSVPNVYGVIGGGSYCVSDTVDYAPGLSASDTGIYYVLWQDGTAVDTLAGTGASFHYDSTSAPATYTITAYVGVTGCTDNMSGSTTIVANLLPHVYAVTGGGAFCYAAGGLPVGLANSESGINYQIYRNDTLLSGTVSGTGAAVSFGAEVPPGVTATYMVIGTNASTGCTHIMGNSVTLTVNPLPVVYTMAGGGSYCSGDSGVHVYLDGSNLGIKYQLYNSGSAVGLPMNGTGFGLDYGLFTTVGTYTVQATNAVTGCQNNMARVVSVGINYRPTVYSVTGGGTACAGGSFHVGLTGSDAGVRYQLYRDGTALGSSHTGFGSSIDFGAETLAGTYTVIATNPSTACGDSMTSSATIAFNPIPTLYTLSGGGTMCVGGAGFRFVLSGSQAGVFYQPTLGGVGAGGPRLGTGDTLMFGPFIEAGTYVMASTFTGSGCTDTSTSSTTVVVNPLPDAFDVLGGGTYCFADSGVHVSLPHSDSGDRYQLYVGGSPVGSPIMGTGDSISFGLETTAGSYTVVAEDPVTACSVDMTGSVDITIQPYLTPTVSLSASPGVIVVVGAQDTFSAHFTGAGATPTFQWFVNGVAIAGATNSTFAAGIYFDQDSVSCEVTSSGMCGGITTRQVLIIRLYADGVPQVVANNSDLKLLPNPNKGSFAIRGTTGNTTDEEVDLEVTDMLGQVVYHGKTTAKGGAIDEHIQLSSSLANGMYLLNVRSAGWNDVFHFVVEQ
jgi:Secretion system C-terminal sorting domain